MNAITGAAARRRNMLAFRLDLLRALGVRHSTRRLLANAQHRRMLVSRHGRVAEEIWRDAAKELGVEVRQLAPALLEFRLGRAVTRVRGQTTPFVDPISEEVASNKPLAYRLLTEAGLSVPAHELVRAGDTAKAEAFLEQVAGPCIVKPARGGGGAGVTGEVRTRAQMRRALVAAGRYHDEALLEQQIDGNFYRVLVLNGDVLDIIERRRPRVVGDGRSTIEQLMLRQYAERIASDGPAGLKPFFVDLDCLFTLEQAGRGLTSVLPPGQALTTKTTTNYNGADQTKTLEPPYPDPFISIARRAAAVLGVRLAGVDLLANDRHHAVVLEVNPTPGLAHHYNVADPARASRIAVPILAALLRDASDETASAP